MATLAQPYSTLSLPRTALPENEFDLRVSDTADTANYLATLHAYIAFSVLALRRSQIKALDTDFAPLKRQLQELPQLQVGWDGYDAPPPTLQAIDRAQDILQKMQDELVRPQWVSASAEGGVAFLFTAPNKRRAQIEVLNNGDKFVHLYDLDGYSHTEEWQNDLKDQPFGKLVEPILHYLRG